MKIRELEGTYVLKTVCQIAVSAMRDFNCVKKTLDIFLSGGFKAKFGEAFTDQSYEANFVCDTGSGVGCYALADIVSPQSRASAANIFMSGPLSIASGGEVGL